MTLLTLTLAVGLQTVALQESPPDDQDMIIVTGTRFDSEAKDWPQTIQILDISDQDIEGLMTLTEGLSGLRGVQVFQSGPIGSQASLFLRGTNSKHALVMLDGIRLNDPSSANGIFDAGATSTSGIDRIEIATGPLSSVYGSDAVGGVINIIPLTGGDKPVIPTASMVLGTQGFAGVRASVRGSTDRVVYALSGEAIHTDGFDSVPERMSTFEDQADEAGFRAITASVGISLTDQIQWQSLVRAQNSEVEFDTFSGGPSESQRANSEDLSSETRTTIWRTGLLWKPATGGVEASLRGGQVINDLETFGASGLTDSYTGTRHFSELLFEGQPETGLLSWSTGVQWQNERADTQTRFNNPLDRDEDQLGVFGLIQFEPAPIVVLTASARWDDYEAFGSAETYQVGGVLNLEQLHTRLRASIGTSFKAPTLSERYSASLFIQPNPDLMPEESESWEVGFDTSTTWIGGRAPLEFGAMVYRTDIENLIETEFDFTTFTGQNVNIGEADINGYEAYMTWQPLPAWGWSLDYAYTDARNGLTGSRLLRRAPHVWTASVEWQASEQLRLTLKGQSISHWQDVTYDDDGFFSSSNASQQGYQLLHASGQFQLSNDLSAGISVRNLTDETYEQPAAFAGEPRSVRLVLRYGGSR